MGQLVKNKSLNYWICGLIFAIIYSIVLYVVTAFLGAFAAFGLIIYIIVMPYITGRLVDYISDKWMD